MKDVPENELLSAYLDGELTAAEQAEVERLLARSPAARQLLEELRTLSSKLQGLPQYKLEEDLSGRVLRVAERRMLTQPAPPGELPKPAPAPRRAILRRVFNSRALAWSSLAVAVAVMLTVINRGPEDRPAGDGLAKAPPAADENGGRISEIGAAPAKADLPRDLGDSRSGGTPGRKSEAAQLGYGAATKEYPAKDRNSDSTLAEDRAQLAKDPVFGKEGITRKLRANHGGAIVHPAGQGLPLQCDVLVQCKVSPEASREGVFDKALADNKIVWDEARGNANLLAGNGAVGLGQQREPVAQQKRGDTNGPVVDAVPDKKVDLVYVEAPLAQFEGMLTALKTRPGLFSLDSLKSTAEMEARKDSGTYIGAHVQSPKRGAAGTSQGHWRKPPAADEPVALPKQTEEGRDKLRAYARRIRFPGPGFEASLELFNRDAARAGSVVLFPPPSQPKTPEKSAPKSAPKTVPVQPGQPAEGSLAESDRQGTPGGVPTETPFHAKGREKRQWSDTTESTPPAGQRAELERLLKEQSRQRQTDRTELDVPMIRALFVLRVIDFNSTAASLEERSGTATMAPKDRKAAPRPAAQK